MMNVTKPLITTLLVLAFAIYAIYLDVKGTIADLINDHQTASDLMAQLGKGNTEALYELEDKAKQGRLAYALSLASYHTIEGEHPKRDQIIREELEKANSLESLFILQEFAYLFDNEALANMISDQMEKDGSIPTYVYASMQNASLSQEELDNMSQCYKRLGSIYGKPPALNWKHYLKHGVEHILWQTDICQVQAPPKKSV